MKKFWKLLGKCCGNKAAPKVLQHKLQDSAQRSEPTLDEVKAELLQANLQLSDTRGAGCKLLKEFKEMREQLRSARARTRAVIIFFVLWAGIFYFATIPLRETSIAGIDKIETTQLSAEEEYGYSEAFFYSARCVMPSGQLIAGEQENMRNMLPVRPSETYSMEWFVFAPPSAGPVKTVLKTPSVITKNGIGSIAIQAEASNYTRTLSSVPIISTENDTEILSVKVIEAEEITNLDSVVTRMEELGMSSSELNGIGKAWRYEVKIETKYPSYNVSVWLPESPSFCLMIMAFIAAVVTIIGWAIASFITIGKRVDADMAHDDEYEELFRW